MYSIRATRRNEFVADVAAIAGIGNDDFTGQGIGRVSRGARYRPVPVTTSV